MIVIGAVCVPGIADYVGDILDEETIREAFLTFNRTGQLIDVQHTLQPVGRVLESYIIESEMEFMGNTYPKGSWFISVDVTDTEIQEAIRSGEYTGFSILAMPVRSVESMKRQVKE